MQEQTPNQKPKQPIGKMLTTLVVGLSSGVALVASPDTLESFMKIFSETSQSQIAQAGVFFILASIIHSGRTKKEIRANFENLIVSIDNVSLALREDLKKHGERLNAHGELLDILVVRVDSLEGKPKTNNEGAKNA